MYLPWLYSLVAIKSNGVIISVTFIPPIILATNNCNTTLCSKYPFFFNHCLAYSKDVSCAADPIDALGICDTAPLNKPLI